MSKLRESVVSNCEKTFLLKCLTEYMRLDGRAFHEFREIQIEFGKEWGCCYVSLGKTKVLAQVSCEVQQPKSSRPSEGVLNINVELNPLSAPHFEAGRQSELSVQLNRLLEKCIKDSKTVDLESLCIKVNEKVWAFRVDVNVLNHEGNILDCASIAALSALAHFRRPDVTWEGEDFIVHSYQERDPIPTVIYHYPVCISYAIFDNGSTVLADPTLLEENVAEAHLTVGLNAYKELCGLHLGGKAQIDSQVILTTTEKAAKRALIVVGKIKHAVEENNKLRETVQNVGFQYEFDLDKEVTVDEVRLENCLDTWKVKKHKNKRKGENKTDVVKDELATIESLGKGSAVLLPNDVSEAGNVWNISSEDESEPDVVIKEEVSISKNDERTEVSTDSEEECIVVLNDKKRNKS